MLATATARLEPDHRATRPIRWNQAPRHEAPGPEDGAVLVSLYLQDPEADKAIGPQEIAVPSDLVQVRGDRIEGPHFSTVNSRAPRTLAADEDGNLIFDPHTPEFDMVSAHVHAEQTVALFEDLLGMDIRWKFGDPRRERVAIRADARHEEGSHAQLENKRMVLDYYRSNELGREVRAAESAEIVSHETGHFILHALRPILHDTDAETNAFHEAFGDIAAMLYSLQFDANVVRMANETRGDWSRNNIISKFGEEDGKATQKKHYPDGHTRHDLRSAINDFGYQPPHETPESTTAFSNTVVSPEVHDFSRIFSGAFYDVLTALADREVQRGACLVDAICTARDRLSEIWAETIKALPGYYIRFATVAQRMVDADRDLGGGEVRMLKRIFADRGIATQ
ncbi:MAG: hypothetical protein FJX76_12255 [Armatimonadetes bacterium]|nr:hypothetical protein [Armatimonadota bacterium]